MSPSKSTPRRRCLPWRLPRARSHSPGLHERATHAPRGGAVHPTTFLHAGACLCESGSRPQSGRDCLISGGSGGAAQPRNHGDDLLDSNLQRVRPNRGTAIKRDVTAARGVCPCHSLRPLATSGPGWAALQPGAGSDPRARGGCVSGRPVVCGHLSILYHASCVILSILYHTSRRVCKRLSSQ